MTKRRKIESNIDNDTKKQEEIITGLKAKKSKDTVRITLDIPKQFHAKIKAYTKARGQSIKGYLLFLAAKDMEEKDSF